MKRIFVLIMAIAPCASFAAAPSTSCPSGYVTIEEKYMTIAAEAYNCPAGYSYINTVSTCLAESPDGSCIMFAPPYTEYSDSTGIYEFTAACPLE